MEYIDKDLQRYSELNIFGIEKREKGCIIDLEGTICAGKSTLGKALCEYLNSIGKKAIFLPEGPPQKLLALFYSGMSKEVYNPYALTFQLHMMNAAQSAYKIADLLAKNGYIVIIDRGVLGNSVFAAVHHSTNSMTETEFEAYIDCLVTDCRKNTSYKSDIIVYLDVVPKEALRRITKERKTPSEQGIPLEYLENLHDTHIKHLKIQEEKGQSKVLILDNNTIVESKEIWSLINGAL